MAAEAEAKLAVHRAEAEERRQRRATRGAAESTSLRANKEEEEDK